MFKMFYSACVLCPLSILSHLVLFSLWNVTCLPRLRSSVVRITLQRLDHIWHLGFDKSSHSSSPYLLPLIFPASCFMIRSLGTEPGWPHIFGCGFWLFPLISLCLWLGSPLPDWVTALTWLAPWKLLPPVKDLGKMQGMWASLLRWKCPKSPMIPPATLPPVTSLSIVVVWMWNVPHRLLNFNTWFPAASTILEGHGTFKRYNW